METNKIYKGDAYELIKQIPDKSIDLIYTDIPYLMNCGGSGNSPISHRIVKRNSELGDKNSISTLQKQIAELKTKMDQSTTKEEYEKWHCRHSNLLNKLNLDSADIVNGIDYKILDEFVRIQPYIYIYMVQ